MKTHKTLSPLQWLVTLFMCLFLLHPSRACVAAPDPCQVSNSSITNNITLEKHDPLVQKEDSKLVAPVIFFVIIVAVFCWIIYQLIKLLDKVIPPEKKPDPPPNSGNTNYPPIVINPTQGPEPALRKHYDGPMKWLTNSTGCTITNYNIVTYQWTNTWEQGATGLTFDHYWAVSTEISTNLQTWEDTHYSIECFYTAGVGVLYRYRHYGTNFYQCYYSSQYFATNHIAPAYFNLTDRPYQPNQYFELISQ